MPLPKTRERALTFTSEMPEQRQQIYEQAQSNFFARLPAELRTLIYTEILGGNVLHIVKREKRLGHSRCTVNRLLQDERVYVCRSPTDRDLMPMLKSCRKVYLEAIHLLYSRNVFAVNCMDSLIYLSYTTLSHRFNAIRALDICWDFNIDDIFELSARIELEIPFYERIKIPGAPYCEISNWNLAWRVIAGMQGLQELRVRIVANTPFGPRAEASLLEPLGRVQQTSLFEVEVPWIGESNVDVPYRIVRHDDLPVHLCISIME